jgi:hypothetical protein
MKSYLAVLLFIIAQVIYAQAQDGSDILASAIDNLPPCAVRQAKCFLEVDTDEIFSCNARW